MTRNLKLFGVLLVAMVGLGLFVAGANVPTPEEANINWHQFEGTTVRALLVAHPWEEGISPKIAEFEALTGIKLDVQVISEDLFWDRVVTGLSADKPPFDVFFVSGGYDVYSYYLNDWIAPLDSFLQDPTLTDPDWYDIADISPGYLAGFYMPDTTGSLFAIPISSEVYINFYRKDVFEELGIDVDALTTMDAWLAAVQRITKETDLYGAVVRGGATGISDELEAMALNYLGDRPYETGKGAFFDPGWCPRFTDQRITEAFGTWGELMRNSPPGVTAFTWYDASTAFAQGLAATFWCDASLFAPEFEDPDQSTVAGKVGYAVLPPSPYGHATGYWAWGIGITAKAEQTVKKASWLFIEWATSKYGELFSASKTWGAVRQSTWKLPEMKEVLPVEYVDTVSQSLAIAKYPAMHFSGGEEVIINALDALHAIYQGTPASEAMATLQDKALSIVDEATDIPEPECSE